jgi:hypothetical protein
MDFMTYLIPSAVVVGVGVFFAIRSARAAGAMRAAASGQGPQATAFAEAYRRFFEATGYRYAEIADAPVDAQVTDALRRMQEAMRDPYKKTHMVREREGLAVHWEQETRADRGGGWSTSCDFTAPLKARPATLWHVAERSFGSKTEALKGMVTNLEHNWKPAFATRIETGDAAFDKRFQLYGDDEGAVRAILGDASLKSALLAMTEVDLRVLPDRVSFADPLMNNLRAAYGGNAGMIAAAGDPGRLMEMSTPFHNHVAALIVTAARLSA